MITVRTLREAKERRYGRMIGMSKGSPYKEGKCAQFVAHGMWHNQCVYKNGHGPGGLYCKIHAKQLERRDIT